MASPRVRCRSWPSGCRLRAGRWLTPGPAQQAQASDDAERADDRPKRAAGHRGPLDELGSLANPDGAGYNKHGSHHTPRDDHTAAYARPPQAVCTRPIYVQRQELDDASSKDDYTIRELVEAPCVRYVLVEGELELRPGLRLASSTIRALKASCGARARPRAGLAHARARAVAARTV